MIDERTVAVASCGRFTAFDLASQLHKRNILHSLITDYPLSHTSRWGIPNSLVTPYPYFGAFKRLGRKLASSAGLAVESRFREEIHKRFGERLAHTNFDGISTFIGMSSFIQECIEPAKSTGVNVVVDHGSLHELTEQKILAAECERHGFQQKGNWCCDWLVERQAEEFENCDYISVLSSVAKQSFVDNGIHEGKILINSCGVDLNSFYPINKCDGTFRIIQCSNFTPRKGNHLLLQAFIELGLPKSELVFVGPMPTDPVLLKAVKKSPRNVKLLGPVPQTDLVNIYGTGSVFCLPSLADGFAMVISQAMACGLPVITTNMVGSSELITNGVNGWVIDSGSVIQIKEKLEWCYSNRDNLSDMGSSARQSVINGHTWDNYGDSWEAFLRKLPNST